jgi:hypothetical protein
VNYSANRWTGIALDRGLVATAALSAVAFALYTDQRWEDTFITLRHSRNAALGYGLTYQPGEHIQGFTSPIVALIAAAGFKAFGADSLNAVMWLLRICNIAGHAVALTIVLRLVAGTTASRVSTLAVCVLFVFETKTLAFTINGMETGILLGLLALAWSMMSRADGISPVRLGLCWAALLWTRPDAAVYIALMAAALLVWPDCTSRRASMAKLARAARWAALLYLPWLLFAQFEYGRIVPQSIVAKSTRVGRFAPQDLVAKLLSVPHAWTLAYLPPYADRGGWTWLAPNAFMVGALGMLLWLSPDAPSSPRRTSFVAFGATLYLALLQGDAPWYFPPAVLFSAPAVAFVVGAARPRAWAAVAVAASASLFAYGCVAYARQARAAEINERENRYTIGRWLREQAKSGDRIYLEGPGIIGYYAQRKMLDYPGLIAPEVVSSLRRGPYDMATPVVTLRPEWLVLRPDEMREALRTAEARETYRAMKVFDTRRELFAIVGDQPSLLSNAAFTVLRRSP